MPVRTFDTNVVVRLVLNDDPPQAQAAVREWTEALRTGGIFLPAVVLIEVAWVLAQGAKFSRERILLELRRLTGIPGVSVEQAALVRRALDAYAVSSADFSDCMILESARHAGALPVYSFDRRFARHSEVSLIEPGPVT